MRKVDNLLCFYDNPRENGIFYAMFKSNYFKQLLNNMGITTDEQAHAIDMDYMYNHSGLKSLSVLLEEFIKGYIIGDDGEYVYVRKHGRVSWDYVVTRVDEDIIDFVLKTRYLYKWEKLFENATADFDALNPFHIDYSEKQEADLVSKDTSANTFSDTSHNAAELTSNGESLISGFNSSTPVNSDEQNRTQNSNDTTTNEGTQNRTNDYTRQNTVDRTYVRQGNIGNHSQSDLLVKQREYLQFVLLKQIYLDLDEVLTRSKYY
jgi:hypothetical protein